MQISTSALLVALIVFAGSAGAAAQTPPPGSDQPAASAQVPSTTQRASAAPARLRVMLDCDDCFGQFVRDEIGWVDFVLRREDADVQVLSSRQSTGGGGRQIVLRFVGRGQLVGVDKELRVTSEPGATEDERRRAILGIIRIGLLDYLARQGQTAGLNIEVDTASTTSATVGRDDPWNLWVFSVRGSGGRDSEESNQSWRASFDTTADRVTDRWKLSFGVHVNERGQTFNIDDGDGMDDEIPLEIRRHRRSVDWFVARGINDHVSVGLDGRVMASTYDNLQRGTRMAPAIEFNLFPYREYATRQLRVEYSVNFEHSLYEEATIYDKMKETLWRHQVSATLDQRQPWGEMHASVEWSQYLHDLSKTHLDFFGGTSFRLLRGLSVNINADASRIHDQISLPQRGASAEEILLQIRQLESSYQYSFSAGITYTFGSIFSAIVNPRFGTFRGGGGGGGGFGGGPGGGGGPR